MAVSHLSKYATQDTNTTGEMTPILTYDPENGTKLQLRNKVQKGSEMGVPFAMTLQDSAGVDLPDDTEVLVRVERPLDESPLVVSEKIKNISSWNVLTQQDQRNSENIDATKIELKGKIIEVRDVDTLRIEVKSSAQIDWANSELYVNGKATRTVSR